MHITEFFIPVDLEFCIDQGDITEFSQVAAVTALRHETVDHAVKTEAIVKTILDQLFELFHGFGGKSRYQFDDDQALRHIHENGVFRIEFAPAWFPGCPQTG